MTTITIPAPDVPFPGGRSQASFMRRAARDLEGGFPLAGTDVRTAVLKLLRDAAAALDDREMPAGGASSDEVAQHLAVIAGGALEGMIANHDYLVAHGADDNSRGALLRRARELRPATTKVVR
jgi:hypothetical protein